MLKRLFAAIKVEPDDQFLEIFDDLKIRLDDEMIRWVDEKNIHITLKFFGEIPDDDIDGICDVFENVAQRHNPFIVPLRDIGIFGSSYNPRVVWFGMEKCPEIDSLAGDVLKSLIPISYSPDGQKFRAHLTVGRIKFLKNRTWFQEVINNFKGIFIQKLLVEEFHLFDSKLRPQGPLYSKIESFRLGS
nr:RNA 2',3'-cyclic phosphodiesterase [Bacteroidota bacterium]